MIAAERSSLPVRASAGRGAKLLLRLGRRVDRPVRIGAEGMVDEEHPGAVGSFRCTSMP